MGKFFYCRKLLWQIPQHNHRNQSSKTFWIRSHNIRLLLKFSTTRLWHTLSQLPQLCAKGRRIAITIPEDEYHAGVETCKRNLHDRIIWPKDATLLRVDVLCTKLSTFWKPLRKWGITSLDKNFYEFSFSSLDDVRSVRAIIFWNLSHGYLKLFARSWYFNP